MKAVDVLFEVLRSEGVARIFGNPGSTEMPLMDQLYGQTDFTYTLGLQEATVVGMADGFAQATNRAAFVNLHTAGGIGHAMGTIAGSKLTRTPLVITAGNQDTRHLAREPWLSGDLVAMARPCVKWAVEVNRAEDVGIVMRRAFAIANAHPRGPVFVSLPMNLMLEEVQHAAPPKSAKTGLAAGDISELLQALAETPAEKTVLLLSDAVIHDNATVEAVQLAECLGVRVFGTPLLARNVFPAVHANWRGVLPPDFAAIRKALQDYELCIVTGDHEMLAYSYREGGPFPDGLRVAQISPHGGAMGMDGPVAFAVQGGIKATFAALARDIGPPRQTSLAYAAEHAAAHKQVQAIIEAKSAQLPLYPTVALKTLLQCIPEGSKIVNESSGTYDSVREQWLSAAAGDYYFVRSGNLGWGMPAAVGVALAEPAHKVISFVGDGAFMYSPQAIWSSVRYGANVCFVVFNNRKYDILMRVAKGLGFANANANQFVEMNFEQPPIDFSGFAQCFDILYAKAKSVDDIPVLMKTLMMQKATVLLEIETSGL
jgi:benzoylformate decarboxylase